ncbi:hypothetical protein PAXRUDRAFT_835348, partial [Paxillus rubicundulus Ve08.2h10]
RGKAEVRTPGSWESGGMNSRSRESRVGVPAAPGHWPMDTKESKDDQRGPNDEEEPSDVGQEPGSWSKHLGE